MTTFAFLTFEQWLKANPDLKETKEECKECNGAGRCNCDCGDEHDCGYCDGSGVQVIGLEDLYLTQLRKDKKLIEQSAIAQNG